MPLVFGDCAFYRERRELLRQDVRVSTGPKLLALLELLIDSRPRALTKDEIHHALWPDTFVSDATLTSLVAELRAAVGDDARRPRLIRTIHGYGYAFCGEIVADAEGSDSGSKTCSYRVILGDREVALSKGPNVLGRSNAADICVDDIGVSRHHARITVDDQGATLEDLGSKNGTLLNGRIIDSPMALADGARIVLGTTALRFRVFKTQTSTETVRR